MGAFWKLYVSHFFVSFKAVKIRVYMKYPFQMGLIELAMKVSVRIARQHCE